MAWPTPQDYQEAMQNPRSALGNPELQSGRAEEDQLGLPRPISGGFASVYKVFCPPNTWAVRCFLKEFLDQQQRYAAISNQLALSRFAFATRFEFFQQGIRIRGVWYPILKMEWVQGESLIRFVETNLYSPQKLLSIALDVVAIVEVLNRAGVAHGDLQHGNILVANGKPKLIDYDGMYVPALTGWQTHEAGHPNYQLSRDDSDFGPGLDNFSVWVIYLSLRALSLRPTLWAQFQGGDDCLLLRRTDFENPTRSAVLQELKRFPEPEIRQLATAFESLLRLSPLKIPLIDPGSPKAVQTVTTGPDWIVTHLPQKRGQVTGPSFNLADLLAQINRIPRPIDVCPLPQASGARAKLWPLLANPAAPPALPGILVSPPPFPAFVPPPAKFYPTKVPVQSVEYCIGLGGVALVLISLLLVSSVIGAIVGVGVCCLAGAVVFIIWWAILETNRRHAEYEANQEYEKERSYHNQLQREHLERCKRKLGAEQERARMIYEDQRAKWNSAILPYKREAEHRRAAVQDTKAQLERAMHEWKAASDGAIRLFDQKKTDLLRLTDNYDNIESQREAELKQILAKAREIQFDAHLRQHLIQVAAIENIGNKLKKKLIDHGIRTAFDVGRYGWPTGFGDARRKLIVQWRRNVEATFIFKTANAIPPHEINALEARYQHLREGIQRQLVAGEQELRKFAHEAGIRLGQLASQIKSCGNQLHQAEADLTVIPGGL